jgi:hypothetical protein
VGNSILVRVIKSLQHLLEEEKAYFWSEATLDNIIEELATVNKLHDDVGNWNFAAVSLCLDAVGLIFDAFDDVRVLQLKHGINFFLKVGKHLGFLEWIFLFEYLYCDGAAIYPRGQFDFAISACSESSDRRVVADCVGH